MSEFLRFDNYRLDQNPIEDIYDIGKTDEQKGVVLEISDAFGHELADVPSEENLGILTSIVGPNKELQKNIQHVKDVLGAEALRLSTDWVDRSGLLAPPVERSFLSDEEADRAVSLAVITGGVRNWMARRAHRLAELKDNRNVDRALLVGGNRAMNAGEGPDVEEGMKEYDYLERVVALQLADLGISSKLVKVESGSGDEVSNSAAEGVLSLVSRGDKIAVVSNAGIWIQNVGQIRRALKNSFGEDFDQDGQQLVAVSDSFPLGTGEEPTATHQNPFSALGQITRNAQELVRHY